MPSRREREEPGNNRGDRKFEELRNLDGETSVTMLKYYWIGLSCEDV